MTNYDNVLQMIGNTPMLKVSKLDTGVCELYIKLELANPGGSIKDRIGLSMINAAEQAGKIRPGDTLIEATAGNTGVGLALVSGQKGYKLNIVIPDKMSVEKIDCLRAMGADVVLTRSDVTKGDPAYYQDLAEAMAVREGWYYVNQFCNRANVLAHFESTGPEIWRQMEGRIDAFVCGVGTGGTLSGAGGYLKEKNGAIDIVLADPDGSVLAPLVATGRMPDETGSWHVEGIGEDFVPDICNLSLVSKAYTIGDSEAFGAARQLFSLEGIMAGSSSGTLLAAALRYCREQRQPKRVVTLACDTGNRYLSKLYNDQWIEDNLRG